MPFNVKKTDFKSACYNGALRLFEGFLMAYFGLPRAMIVRFLTNVCVSWEILPQSGANF